VLGLGGQVAHVNVHRPEHCELANTTRNRDATRRAPPLEPPDPCGPAAARRSVGPRPMPLCSSLGEHSTDADTPELAARRRAPRPPTKSPQRRRARTRTKSRAAAFESPPEPQRHARHTRRAVAARPDWATLSLSGHQLISRRRRESDAHPSSPPYTRATVPGACACPPCVLPRGARCAMLADRWYQRLPGPVGDVQSRHAGFGLLKPSRAHCQSLERTHHTKRLLHIAE
jgi:hypothetical protein